MPPAAAGGGEDKIGPLGKPIRRTNTFSSSLAVLEETHHEGPGAQGLSGQQQHSSGDDLVQRLLGATPPPAVNEDLASMLTDFGGGS